MRVLFITIDGLTDPLGQSQIIPYLSGLSANGYDVSILSCEKKNRLLENKSHLLITLRKAGINWYHINYKSTVPFLSQWFNVIKLRQFAEKLHKKKKFNLLHCRSYIPALIGLMFKKKYKTKFVFDMRGFWANERLDGGIWKLNNLAHKKAFEYFKKKEIEFIEHADCVISLTNAAKKEIQSWKEFNTRQLNIKVIPCCVDLKHFNYTETDMLDSLRQKLNLQNSDFVLSYLGSLGTWYMLEEMLLFFKQLSIVKANAKFLFITGDDSNEIFTKARNLGIDKDSIRVYKATRNEVPLMLNLSDFSIFFIKPLYSKKASSPTKMAEILACGLPFITNTGIGDSDEIIKDTDSGILVKSFTEMDFQDAINQMDRFLSKDKLFYRLTAKNLFSLQNGIEVYDSVYASFKEEKSAKLNALI